MAAPVVQQNENSSDVVLIEGPDVGATVELSPLSPELMEDWQKNKSAYGRSHYMKYLLNSGRFADVTFTVNNEDGMPEKILAHKSVLKFKSEFFTVLFSERWKNDEVDLTDSEITSCDFKTFMEFLYMGQAKLTSDNVMALYYMSNLYQITELRLQCETFLQENIDEENVLTLFKAVFLQDAKRSSVVLHELINFICTNGESMLEKPEFLELNQNQLALIFSRQRFQCKPMRMLRFCLRWTVKKFGKKKLQNFKELDRYFEYDLELGRRYCCTFPKLGDLLDFREDFLGASYKPPPVKPDALYEIQRLRGIDHQKPWVYRRNHADRISFRCTESIILTGIGLYGDYEFGGRNLNFAKRFCASPDQELQPAKYGVEVRIHVHGKSFKELLYLFRKTGSDMNLGSCIYNIDFKPLYLHSDEWYTISVTIAGPPSHSGSGGVESKLVRCGNTPVIFEFQEASSKDEQGKLSNSTGVPIGQIPKLFFKLATDGDDDDVEVL